MTPPLFWVDEVPRAGDTAVLSGPEGRHAVTVTRITTGETVILGDGRGTTAVCEVVDVAGKDKLTVRAGRVEFQTRPKPTVTIVQALPKAERSELAVDLMTEAGVDAIVPWQSARSIARWSGTKAVKGVEKWRTTAATAAKQARRAWTPEVADLAGGTAVRALAARVVADGGIVALLHEDGAVPFRSIDFADVPEVVFVIGPEGGLTDAEIADLTALGARSVVLGPEVLRTAAAGAVALGALGAVTDRWTR
ncbi:16S rRNA (uracil(1498)-N(3))-methyltransferase [Gordonia sp. (in: high G+C Gram-positive bacteria)]|uniref:16S rRNA (uracil(1498)-N(3))-methyltransferase n=1 Tax=Gordonia sp. (in: high G+C Gram-positive bacteria) TaxID=84139 RepID=UPI0016AB384C|nr:16S rRNA (uracil(1498)-N(3))-methyltransferase [Gordonia sp. (in: high G+C Gram-positive bacteria)]NLG48318.1 16S rRNA (uracil(1498)-N(3))-methyltransferase [Gordonia sp. (in: high G+C Gram-positive bacteria)]